MTDAVSARALLFDADGRVVLIRRTPPGVPAYLTTPGGGVEAGEPVGAAAARECHEELALRVVTGATVADLPAEGHHVRQVVLLAQVLGVDPAGPTGAELRDPARGGYGEVRVDPSDAAGLIGLRPTALQDLLRDRGAELADRAARLR